MLDRADDMIVSGGFNIWPAELETVIADHPEITEITEVAVFGIPHERWGETPMAVCCVEQGASVTAEEIVELVKVRLGSYRKRDGSSSPATPSPLQGSPTSGPQPH